MVMRNAARFAGRNGLRGAAYLGRQGLRGIGAGLNYARNNPRTIAVGAAALGSGVAGYYVGSNIPEWSVNGLQAASNFPYALRDAAASLSGGNDALTRWGFQEMGNATSSVGQSVRNGYNSISPAVNYVSGGIGALGGALLGFWIADAR